MRVTFDSNVWRIVTNPDMFSRDPEIQTFKKIRQAIIANKITPCIAETVFTLEAIENRDRKDFLAAYKPEISISEEAQADGTTKISFSMGPAKDCHPGNNSYLSQHLQEALSIGFKLLRCPRIAGMKNPDIMEDQFLSDGDVSIEKRQDVFASVAKEIEDKGCGISHIKKIGEKYDSQCWIIGIRRSPVHEAKNIEKAVAEWADGDSLAAHAAYKNNYFCTRDRAKSGGSTSVLSSCNKQWLEKNYGVIVVTPKELFLKIAE